MIPIVSAILYRLDGWGKDDGFLPIKPFNKWTCGGINYARYFIGVPVAIHLHNWVYILTYAVAVSIPYKEGGWLEKHCGPYKWFIIGALFGGAALSWGNALWVGMAALSAKVLDIDHAWWEFGVMGVLGTIIYLWR